jgi:alginate O-acetyltransferase complex protein AlgI
MLFNSLEFAVFMAVVFSLYWFVFARNVAWQNLFLLVAGYFFYAWWDWRFLSLLISLSLANYFIGIEIGINELKRRRRIWLIAGLIVNTGVLGIFKYYNFFADSFGRLISLTGYKLTSSVIKIILPLGISFYVFLSLSYLIDIFKKNLKAERNIISVLLTLSFFPIILAGPIQRPSSLLPQITGRREFNYSQASDGLRQILWGLFVKVVIADNLGVYVDDFFNNYSSYSGSTLLIGSVFYAIQIYADFSGYSNIAIGIARLLGFNLMQNFAYPYFSSNIVDFWKRWHISLTSWFRDYIFFPVSAAFSWRIKNGKVLAIKTDIFIYVAVSLLTWFLTGLWHGSNYTFILWGMIHGLFLIMYQLQKAPRKILFKRLGIRGGNKAVVMADTISTLGVVTIAWVIFRAKNIHEGFSYLSVIFSKSLFSIPDFPGMKQGLVISALALIFLSIEWIGRQQKYAIEDLGAAWGRPLRWAMYYSMVIAILIFAGKQQQFIYFQF